MRLIDADALLTERKKSKYYHLPNGDIAIPIIDVEHAPTVQPERERGHWIEGGHRKFIDLANADRQYTELGYPHRTYINMSCSNCGMITIVDASIRYDFCPHCGADMKEV